MNEGFLKLNKSRMTDEMLMEPACFMLLTQIAYRAKRTQQVSLSNLSMGEALLGDYENIGLTRQKYRTALDKLREWGLITTRTTNRGTIAKLISKEVFDINEEIDNHQDNHKKTTNKNKHNNTHIKKDAGMKYGEYKKVYITNQEYSELKDRIGEEKLKQVIKQLDEKLAEGKEKSENHFVTLLKYSRYLKENKIIALNSKKARLPEVKSASFQVKTKEQLYGEANK